MLLPAISKNGIPIRLTDERWGHILADHIELVDSKIDVLETVSLPDRIFEGRTGELLAVREVTPGKWLVVAYRELAEDGFIITAFFTRKFRYLERRTQLWP